MTDKPTVWAARRGCALSGIFLLFLALAVYGQQTTVAVLPSEGAADNDELEALTDEMREAALKALPAKNFVLLK
jgi:hypothetical protein